MKKKLLLLFIVLLPTLLAACQRIQERKTSARMDEIVRFEVENKHFMGSVLVAKGNHTVFSKGYGMANVEWEIPNTSTTKYRLGSVTKQFTAAAILLLEEQGKLKVEDLVKQHWPDAPPAWDKITILHLLTHTSGIADGFSKEYGTLKLSSGPVEKTLGYFRDKPLDFEPGSQYSYSNSGYLVLGYLIERISGQSYGDFIRERIFTPLGMKDSGMDLNTTIIGKRAAGYSLGPNGITNAEYVNMAFPHAAGALYSTTEDLLRWTQGLFGGTLLSSVSLKKMTTPFKGEYAFGMIIGKNKDRTVIFHNGRIDGFTSALAYLPDERTTIAVLSNIDEEDLPFQIGKKLGAILHGETVVLPSERRAVQLSENTLRPFIGLYELDPTANLIITMPNGTLNAQFGSSPPIQLLAESTTRFFARPADEQVEFERDAQGLVTGLVLHRDDEDHRARRLPERVELKLPVEVLSRYTGTYQIEPGFDLVTTVEDGRLMVQATGQDKVQLYAETEEHFFIKEGNLQVEFLRNKDGQTTSLILHQGGDTTRAARR